MANGILGVGKSALAAATAGLTTTGHNIANAATPGYNRQVVIQGTAGSQNLGFGYVGKGTEVVDVRRVYSEYLNEQVLSAQTSSSRLETYYGQISRINNQFADSASGLAPTMQDFFAGLQGMASNPTLESARQTVLSSAETLASRFRGLSGQLTEIRDGVNAQISSSISNINRYASEIAKLNEAIEKANGTADGRPSNDLLDQRDYAVSQLSKEIKTTVIRQGDSYSVFIGNGQPLVSRDKTYELVPAQSKADPSRIVVGYATRDNVIELAESGLTGGKLGGLLEFRSNSLDVAQNSLGRIAIALAQTFNEQHSLGQDQTDAMGGDFFNVGGPEVRGNGNNSGTAQAAASIADADALTTSDYRLQYDGTNYIVTRKSDNQVLHTGALPAEVDGINITITAGAQAGDEFLIKPTANAADGMSVAITDIAKIAAAAPIRTETPASNIGSGQISAGSVDGTFTPASVTPAVTLTYDAANNQFAAAPATAVTVTSGGVTTTYAAGDPIDYTEGATISFGGASFTISGEPGEGDQFTIGRNINGEGDSRNALLLGGLQTADTMANGTTSYQGAYAQLVSLIGNKTREVEVAGQAEAKLLGHAVAAQQSESGVNLDEEAANLIRYQQAYQAAGKVIQTANQLFDVLLALGD